MNNANNWIHGVAQSGDGRGAKLGFPTANLALTEESLRPADGIYACFAQFQDTNTFLPAVLHVGPRPTFPGAVATVELHLLDFPFQELYGKRISFHCVEKLRDVLRFTSIDDLIKAIADDCEKARQILQRP